MMMYVTNWRMALQNPFDSLGSRPKEKRVAIDEEVDGAFSCQYCNEVVTNALYNISDKCLYWECGNGHKSEIRGFDLG